MIARPMRNEARNGLTEDRGGGRGYFFQQPTQMATMEEREREGRGDPSIYVSLIRKKISRRGLAWTDSKSTDLPDAEPRVILGHDAPSASISA